MDFKKLKNKKGITLIALAVTIVVLLILAGVTISSIFSENGIIKKAQQAQETINKAQENDLNELAKLEEQLNEYLNENINEEEYATVNFNTWFGRHYRQECDYLRMYIEFSNDDDKVTFAVGTDWKENIVTESTNKLFSTKNVNMKLYQEPESNNSELTIGEEMLMQFTNVHLSDFKLKKGNVYDIKLSIQCATYYTGNVTPIMRDVYVGTTEEITDDIVNIELSRQDLRKYVYVYDIDGDTFSDGIDGTRYGSMLNDTTLEIPIYTVNALVGNNYKCIMLLDENNEIINSDYIGLDINRDGYISLEDGEIIVRERGRMDY